MPVARPESSDARIIAHVDMDCFYVQVEQRKLPELRGLPCAVVQYNEWKGGALIAVSYEARKHGVKRSMRGDEAKDACPQIKLVQVPVGHGKADLSTYRNAGSEVVAILARKGRCERASIDEVYLDLTEAAEAMLAETPPESLEKVDEEALKSHILGLQCEDENVAKEIVKEWLCRSDADHRDKLLACGTLIVSELRMQVLRETEFTCSAGIAHNKMLAKLASGMNKPAQQTVVPFSSVNGLLNSLPIKRMKQLGGKLGTSLQNDLGVNTVGDLLNFTETKLQQRYGVNTGTWLWNIARGISGEEVQDRLLPKSHGSGKTFPGPRALKTVDSVRHWLNQLSEELGERLCSDLEQNKRIARTLTLHATAFKSRDSDSVKKFPSKSCPLRYGAAKIQEDAFNLFKAGLREYLGSYAVKTQESQNKGWGITGLSISASRIVPILPGTCSIMKYFHGQDTVGCSSEQLPDNSVRDAAPLSTSCGSENISEMISTDAKTEASGEEVCINYPAAILDQQEGITNTCNNQEPCCSSLNEAPNGFSQETSPPSRIVWTESCSEPNQSKSKREEHFYETKSVMLNKKEEQKRSAPKFKGTPSILQFFKNHSASCSGDGCFDESILPNSGRNNSRHGPNHMQQGREAWNYNIDEIDPAVIDELPPEIQDEIRAWLRPNKRPNTVKQRSTIAHYFLPSKNK